MFAEILEGGDQITARLRHVTDDQKTYKQNIKHGEIDMSELERKKAAAEARRLAQKQKDSAAAPPAEPVLRLEGDKRWVVKHQLGSIDDQLQLRLNEVEMRHAVRVENCEHAFIEVTGKVNSLSIVNCKHVQVALQTVVSSLEVLNSSHVDVQVALSAPTISIERCDVVNVYLLDKEEARNTEIVTSCNCAVNVSFPSEKDDNDVVERALPEQFVSRIVSDGKGGFKVDTKPSETF